ncbi:unnamed protein product [Arabis nemorensis]|uniref:Uncharacterized protein n=1 Tax=Arabis nemorensis TaxID=586526 RepID=A0A565BEL9_9BRAS|nr:unnamed protein product [Arabis nemorensis]
MTIWTRSTHLTALFAGESASVISPAKEERGKFGRTSSVSTGNSPQETNSLVENKEPVSEQQTRNSERLGWRTVVEMGIVNPVDPVALETMVGEESSAASQGSSSDSKRGS